MHYNTWLPCIYIDYDNSSALVRSNRTGKSFPVHLPKNIKYLISTGDRLHVIKSHVTGEWTVIDYNKMTALMVGDEA